MQKVLFFPLAILSWGFLPIEAKLNAPTHLRTDLMEYTSRMSQGGYLTWKGVEEWTKGMETVEIHSQHPRLGWQVESTDKAVKQTAWRVLMATSPSLLEEGKADVWDSQRQEGSQSVSVETKGKELQGGKTYWWKVKVWDNHDQSSPYSAAQTFRTAQEMDGAFPAYPLQKSDTYPMSITQLDDKGHWMADFGKAAFGQLRLTLSSWQDNDTITIHLGEAQKDGRVNRQPGGTIRYCSYRLPLKQGRHSYTLSLRPDARNTNAKANESGVSPILMPSYIGEVYPFRYVEIDDYEGNLQKEDITRPVVNYPFNGGNAKFECSDTGLNQVWDLCKHTIQATSFCGLYVDGDRERIPYEADTYINQLSHYGVDNEYSMARNTIEHLLHYPTWPTEWILQGPLMAWNDYLYTGDDRLLRKYYDLLKAHTLMGLKETNGLISTRTGKVTPAICQSVCFKGKKIRDIVDWPQSGALGIGKDEAGEADGYDLTDYNTVVNAYHYEALKTLAKIAKEIGESSDAAFYDKESQKVATIVNKLLYDAAKGCYRDGIGSHHYALHASMFPLCFGLVAEKQKDKVLQYIHSRRMACSVYGAQFLLDALYEAADASYALQLMTARNERSWLGMIDQGSTITLEAWGSKFKPNLDWNHAWGTAPANIIPRKLMGVEPLSPGFGKVRIHPQPASLEWAKASIPTIRGNIDLSLQNTPGKCVEIDVTIPANMEAEIWMPSFGKHTKLTIDGNTVSHPSVSKPYIPVNLQSGTYHLKTFL